MDSSVYQCSNFPYYKCDAQLEGEIYEKWTYRIVVENNVRHSMKNIMSSQILWRTDFLLESAECSVKLRVHKQQQNNWLNTSKNNWRLKLETFCSADKSNYANNKRQQQPRYILSQIQIVFLPTRSNFGTQDAAKVALSIPNQRTKPKTLNHSVDFKLKFSVFHRTTHMLLTFLHFILFVSTYISQFYYNQSQGLPPFAFLAHVCVCVYDYIDFIIITLALLAGFTYIRSLFRSITKRLYVCSRTRASL